MDGVGIGEKVREERERRGWSARTLAQRAGVSHAYVSHLEAGQYTRPGVEQLRRIAGALGVGVEYLLGGEGSEERDETLEEIQVNLLAIRELDPGALEQLAGVIEAMKEKIERRSREERRKGYDTSSRRGVTGQAGQGDKGAPSTRRRDDTAGEP